MIKNDLRQTDLTLSDFDYFLPEDQIAQHGAEPRDSSRLMVIDRNRSAAEHRIFRDITEYIRPEDVLVINDTRVLPARLVGRRIFNRAASDAGDNSPVPPLPVELLLLRQRGGSEWECLAGPGKRAMRGDVLEFGAGVLTAKVTDVLPDGNRLVEFAPGEGADNVYDALHIAGTVPLPPYITEKLENPERYQTVYSKTEGSAAAPTAGLHFTEELLDRLRAQGTAIAPVLLHVGLGTFRPVKEDRIADHDMHSEHIEVSEASAALINERRRAGGRVIAVGTTSCRTLESAADEDGILHALSDDTGIFIYPGYRFKITDALITNFHLPKSTLLMLVSAFAGRERMLAHYKEAVELGYRFFSFGDAMLIV